MAAWPPSREPGDGPRRLLDRGLCLLLRADELVLEAVGELVDHLAGDVLDDPAPVLSDET